jgi:iron complex outermembrane receptor protein
MTKATAIHIAVLMLCSGMAAAQDSNAPPAAAGATGTEEIQKVVIVSTGSRGSQRTVVDAPVPVDILSNKELTKSGQYSLDKAMAFRVPSFNTVQTPVNDATSLLDPYEIRNLGPSRALILINGKRKNASALVYTQTSPGRGETGSDISAIPADAIKRIEVLRDGASAQYGSDAIAGVVNIILKDSASEGSMTARAGMTGENDGKMHSFSLNHGTSLFDGRGFINYTLDTSKVGLSNRPGKVSAAGEAATFEAPLADVTAFLAKYPDARNVNGSPETKANKFLVNAGYNISDDTKVYGNMAYIDKDVFSYANFRTPYWRPTDYGLLHPTGTTYEGYGPRFIGALTDYNGTIGVKTDLAGWAADFSLTTGGNKQKYLVNNTINRSLMNLSPTSFNAGGAVFRHNVINGDFSKQIKDNVSMYFGTELRRETYETLAGDNASVVGGGADSYAGNDPRNSFKRDRKNYGAYLGATYDINTRFLIDAIGRYEDYSDFGDAFVWKMSSRFKLNDKVTLRGSLSTGFRAPSLHQLYTQKAQYSFVDGKIQVAGTFNNESEVTRAFGVGALKPEKSKSLTLGLGVQPDSNTSMTLDFYSINVTDRIVLSKEIKVTGNGTDPIDVKLDPLGVVAANFFLNALDSRTSGIDVVYNRKNLNLASGKLGVSLSGNYTFKNERDGEVHNTPFIAANNKSVFDETQEALTFTSRPKFKAILGLDLDYSKVNYSLNNTVFGPTRFHQADLSTLNIDTKFKTKTVTDFAINYKLTDMMTLTFNVNNVFDVTPEWEFKANNAAGAAALADTTVDASGRTFRQRESDAITFSQRYAMVTYDGSHFSQLGRMYNVALNVRF